MVEIPSTLREVVFLPFMQFRSQTPNLHGMVLRHLEPATDQKLKRFLAAP